MGATAAQNLRGTLRKLHISPSSSWPFVPFVDHIVIRDRGKAGNRGIHRNVRNGKKRSLGAGIGIGIGIVTDNLSVYGRRNDSTGLTGLEPEMIVGLAEQNRDDRRSAEDCGIVR